MIRRLRDADGGSGVQAAGAAGAAVDRGMADVLTALGRVIDDETALVRVRAAPSPRGRAAVPAPSRRWQSRWWPALRSPAGVAAGLTAAVLAAGAVALAAIVIPAADHSGTAAPAAPAATTAYVVTRVDKALSAADPGLIAQMTVTSSSDATTTVTTREWSYGDQWRSVAYSAGKPSYSEGFASGSVYTLVSYRTGTWARADGMGRPVRTAPGPGGCAPVIAGLPVLFQPGLPGTGPPPSWQPSTVARDLRAAVSCGSLTVAGRPRIGGAETIELTSNPDSACRCAW
jgi:hypothetical protein